MTSKPSYSNILACPQCKKSIRKNHESSLVCRYCHSSYTIIKDKVYFIQPPLEGKITLLDSIKSKTKQIAPLYRLCVALFSPVCPHGELSKFLHQYYKKDMVVINIGSGNSIIDERIINIDIYPYENVHIVSDVSELPLKDKSVDLIVNIALLEHVPYPEKVVNEMKRVLKKNGIVYCVFPFIQGFHASPYDYTRRTTSGIRELYKDFNNISLKCGGGPTSGMLWIFQEWLAMALSFNNAALYKAIHLGVMAITFPLKYLDVYLRRHPMAANFASNIVFVGRKK